MIPETELGRALALLEKDLLPHVVTLKMLNNYAPSMSMRLVEEAGGWALSAYLPVAVSEWDRKTYPTAEGVVFLEGPNEAAKLSFLRELPPETLVLKTGDESVKKWLSRNPAASKTDEYRSFTANAAADAAEATPAAPSAAPGISQSSRLDEEASRLIQRNGYEAQELARYFSAGAEWFGIREDGRLVSVCFVYQNYGSVWEIAGVYTEPEYRGKGLARRLVARTITHLGSRRLVPRYQVKWNNTASIAVAASCGLSEFLRVDHYLVEPR